jgi:hypothetical protein
MNYKLGFLGLGLLGAIGQASANILINPGFEAGNMSGWTTSAFTATNNDSHTGSWSTLGFGNVNLEQDFAPTLGSDISEVSVWVKQPNLSNFFFAFDIMYSDSSYDETLGSGSGAATWTKFDFTSLVNTSKTVTGIRGWGYSAGGTNDVTWYDDFVVNTSTVPEPASFAVLGIGAMVLLRRRKK